MPLPCGAPRWCWCWCWCWCWRADKDVNPANPSVLGVTRFLAEKQLAAQAAAAAAATAAEAIEEEDDDDFSYQ